MEPTTQTRPRLPRLFTQLPPDPARNAVDLDALKHDLDRLTLAINDTATSALALPPGRLRDLASRACNAARVQTINLTEHIAAIQKTWHDFNNNPSTPPRDPSIPMAPLDAALYRDLRRGVSRVGSQIAALREALSSLASEPRPIRWDPPSESGVGFLAQFLVRAYYVALGSAVDRNEGLTRRLEEARQRGVEGLEEQYQAKLEPVLQARLHDGLQVMSVVNLRHTVMGASSMFGGTGRF